jgi:cell division protein FtsW (lipid II flippase)
MAPAIFIGAIAMRAHGVSNVLYLQNVACLVLCLAISCFVIYKNVKSKNAIEMGTLISIILIFILTFIDSGVGEVHRWIAVGPIRLYVSSILSPLLLIILWKRFDMKKDILLTTVTVLIAIVLFYQPDASQITAFGIPVMIILFRKVKRKYLSIAASIGLTYLIVMSWVHLDSLPPVAYVEGIFDMVMNMGVIWTIIGFISLLILPMPFIFYPKEDQKLLSRCLGIYFLILIITPIFGNFPVPLMGYGVSPILGYTIALTWLLKNDTIITEC